MKAVADSCAVIACVSHLRPPNATATQAHLAVLVSDVAEIEQKP